MWKYCALLAASLASICGAQSSFEPARPPALPLAVKSPYLSTWQQAGSDGGNGGYLAGQWPVFWDGAITGWTGYIRVDNITYIWMGQPVVQNETNYYVVQTSYEYTATKSIFEMNVAGQIGMTITFTSPVLPEDLLEMSLPYSYMDVAVHAIDGKTHDVQLYTDISAEWVAGDRSATAQWMYGTTPGTAQPKSFGAPAVVTGVPPPKSPTPIATATEYNIVTPTYTDPVIQATGQGHHYAGSKSPPKNADTYDNLHVKPPVKKSSTGLAYHQVWRQQQLEYAMYNNQAEWGYWFYATDNTADLTYQNGQDILVRGQFIKYGFLNDTQDYNYRAIDDDYPVFGFARDMGKVGKKTQSVLFQISLHQQNCVQFEAAQGNISVPCMWNEYFTSAQDALGYFYNDYSHVFSEVTTFDAKVKQMSYAAAPKAQKEYYTLTALSTRQVFATLDYTNSPENPWLFMEEIASGGDAQTVDVIMPLHPIMIALNPALLKYMLEPLFINQQAGYFPFQYCIHHLGTFPNATGYNNKKAALNTEQQPLEETGNIVILALAYAQRANDNNWLAEHYSLFHQWGEYLIKHSLYPGEQLSTDDFLGVLYNDTNLAVKGIIGIEALAQIANRTGNVEDGLRYTKIAHNYIKKWYTLGFNYNANPPHEVSGYQTRGGNYSLLYNMFADKELGLDLVKQEIYDLQSNFYPTQFDTYGVPLRNGLTPVETKLDWELWVAAIASDSTKYEFINVLAKWIDQTPTSLPMSDFYDTLNGDYAQNLFIARPVVGAMYSLIALESAPKSPIYLPTSD